MIRNNLALLMAQKRRRVNELAAATGISRNTITSTTQNKGRMIQLETINKICQALEVSPTEFFDYLPFDFTFYLKLADEKIIEDRIDGDTYRFWELTATIDIGLVHPTQKKTCTFTGYAEIPYDDSDLEPIQTFLAPASKQDEDKIAPYIKQMSPAFLTDKTQDFEEAINTQLKKQNIENEVELHMSYKVAQS
jgi:DNA-binding Xre family transcriptional regulator